MCFSNIEDSTIYYERCFNYIILPVFEGTIGFYSSLKAGHYCFRAIGFYVAYKCSYYKHQDIFLFVTIIYNDDIATTKFGICHNNCDFLLILESGKLINTY